MAAGLPGMGGGMPGMPGAAPGGAGPGGAPDPRAGVMALIGKALQSSKMAGGNLDVKSLEDAMATVQQNASKAMKSNPKAYQSLLRALQALHAAVTDLKSSPSAPSGPPMTSSLLDMIAPSNSMANPIGGGA
jgi:hypothetical protein